MINLKEIVKNIKVIMFDVDGVLTTPNLMYTLINGTIHEIKSFCIRDGSACWAAKEAGYKVVLCSGRASEILKHRAEKMKIDDMFFGQINKIISLNEICKKYQVSSENVAYMGDDFLDLPILRVVGLPCATNDAVSEVKNASLFISSQKGGYGAASNLIHYLIEENFGIKFYEEYANRLYKELE